MSWASFNSGMTNLKEAVSQERRWSGITVFSGRVLV